MNEMVTIDFYYSIGSRYSYLAATQIDALQQVTGTQVEWQPINSVRLMAQRENSPFAGKPISGQYEWAYRELDAQRWAKLYGVPYLEPRGRVEFDSDLLARSCTAAKRLGKVAAYSRLLFAAMFQESIAKIDEHKCIAVAEACGINSSDFQLALNSPETADRLNATINKAHQAGVFGVPTFIALNELFWGNDRIVLLSHYLQTKLHSDG
ncbi:DsbA family protein [Chamaesiphon sp. VAR_69_metabat_338]|uniref:2-hydroxychromene-2-carboxylate isomerase n=1 Tax=Chamaesiphon sp. VAR_69_metabat_338 TaxID=2964704 RepID=UPI00286E41B8|nr:DsbA family protein [Chamaesiphon sp. VAR_69_metabat_338]